YGLPALGISDLMNEFGLVKFYKACRVAGIKPIGAADVWIGNPNAPDKPFRTMLIIRNDAGYLRLSELLTEAYVGKDRNIHHAELNPEWLENGDNSGLICLSGAHYGEVGVNLLNGNEDAARAAALKYAAWFPDAFYLELQRLPERPE
ncbi:PHP domain-containing protein, partial [Neisseria sp. P0001.S010]